MPFENTAGIGVNNFYGARNTGGAVGTEPNTDGIWQLSVDITGDSLQSAYLPPLFIPKGAHFLRYMLRIDEAFVLTGTTPTLIFGGTAPATDGVILTQGELQAIGTKIPASTGTGTWAVASATGTTAAQKVAKALGGTTPVVTPGVGKGTLIAEYVFETIV